MTTTSLNTPRIALVGHTGRMGAMLDAAWSAAGYTVTGIACAPGDKPELGPLSAADAVVLAVPVSALCEVMGRISPFLHSSQLLMDITSVKVLPMLIMQEFHSGPVIGSHPLFGPASPSPAYGKRSVLVAGRHAAAAHRDMAEALFEALGSSVSWATAREHDHGVAFAQSLNFAMSTAFFATIARHPECLPFLTPSFTRHKEAARKHLTLDRSMFCEFTAHNPCFSTAVAEYRLALREALSGLPALSEEAAVWYATEGRLP